MLEVSNPFPWPVVFGAGRLPRTEADGHGLGCRSIAAFAEKHGGLCVFQHEDGLFRLRLTL